MTIRLLAFDFGTHRTGVASGQSVTGTATPLTTLTMRAGVPRWREVRDLIRAWEPTLLVVGLPLNMDGTDTTVAPAARRFAAELERRYRLPVVLEDERLSSRAVAEHTRLDDPRSHALAACVIAEQYLAGRD